MNSRSEQGTSTVGFGFLVSAGILLLYLILITYSVREDGITPVVGANTMVFVLFFGQFADTYLKETTVPFSSLERVAVTETSRELTFKYDHESRVERVYDWLFTSNVGFETVELPTEEAVRDTRDAFHRHDIPIENDEPTTTVYDGYVVEKGVYFCESCGGQVSPTDSTCPACEHRLRKPVNDGSASEPAAGA